MDAPKIVIVDDYAAMGRAAADILVATVERAPRAAISVPTGSTPVGMFDEVLARVEAGACDLSRIHLFCLDEYIGVTADDPNSLTGWLARTFLDRSGIPAHHIHPLPSTAPDLAAAASAYEAEIARHGGLELAVLGLGGNGHIAYNEPGSTGDSRTRVLSLTQESIAQAAGYFEGRSVPTEAMTVGIGTLLEARNLVLIVSGAAKADVFARALHGPQTPDLPASFLQNAFVRLTVIADRPAAAHLHQSPHRGIS
ncbi:MAG: glucosamine-6-phosphate deaminase [Thermomicrobiales bacterium]